MIPSKFGLHQRAHRHTGRKVAGALAASIAALVLTTLGAPAALAAPTTSG